MGCDIHLHVEFFMYGHWKLFGSPSVPRMYELFSLMAGVRRDRAGEKYSPMFKARGLPETMAWETKDDYLKWDADAHSASYLSAREFSKVVDLVPDPVLKAIVAAMKTLEWEDLKTRVVFWFDN